MNYFFFLDHPDKKLEASVELFNSAPMDLFSNEKDKSKNIYLFFIKNEKWKNLLYCKIQPKTSLTIKKKDLPVELHNQTVFIALTEKILSPDEIPFNDNSMNSIPAWRSNIKISSNYTSTSYQGEIPGSFLELNLSLTSCSPFLQLDDEVENFFYLINFNKNPKSKFFDLDILSSKKELLSQVQCKTNSINVINLDFMRNLKRDIMFIFRSNNYGGIPLYFARTKDNKSFSLEHTHPPQEYLFLGNRNFYQKRKKSYWLDD